MDISSTLGSIKDLANAIIAEVKAIKMIDTFNTTHLSTYEQAVTTLNQSITRLQSIYSYDFPISEHVSLKLSILSMLSKYLLSFMGSLKEYKQWSNKRMNGCCCVKFYTLVCQPPSKVQLKLETNFNQSITVMTQVSELETEILGSAVRIKHPVLQKAWLFMGLNDLNATDIDTSKMQEVLFLMLKSELGEVKNKQYCFELIKSFVTRLDGCLGSEPDGKLSINELNEVDAADKHSVKSILGFERQPNEKETVLDVAIEGWNLSGIIISHMQTSEYKPEGDASYGFDFKNKCAGCMIVPSGSTDQHFYGLNVSIKATDQGWGGTKHAQIRYSINGANPKPFINIDRNAHPDEMYNMKVGPDIVKPGDTVRWWLYCPGWSGWKVNLKMLQVQAVYA